MLLVTSDKRYIFARQLFIDQHRPQSSTVVIIVIAPASYAQAIGKMFDGSKTAQPLCLQQASTLSVRS
jgi:hypothetical protein